VLGGPDGILARPASRFGFREGRSRSPRTLLADLLLIEQIAQST
jgi:hypothetical protein